MEVVIDLMESKEIASVSAGFLQSTGSWILFPEFIEVSLSENGEEFTYAGKAETPEEWETMPQNKDDLTVTFPTTRARYVRVFAKNMKYLPEWHMFAGSKAWIFVDEITINK